MKAGKFAVSIQWGGGHHYFLKYPETLREAWESRQTLQARLDARRAGRGNKGAKPKVRVWQQVYDD